MSCSCADQRNCSCTTSSEPIAVYFPAVVKADLVGGARIIEFECSNEQPDIEGDIIVQDALLGSADHFLKSGHIDEDHYSELCSRPEYRYALGLSNNPADYIIGRPLAVTDLGKGRTGIKAELFSNPNGVFDPQRFKYDNIWKSIQEPSVRYWASIYGYPGKDTEVNSCIINKNGHRVCASRYLVKSFKWCSTALTRHPINNALEMNVRIVTAKSLVGQIMKSRSTIKSRLGIKQSFSDHICKSCPSTRDGLDVNLWTVRDHYIKCENLDYNLADLYALATDRLFRNG